LGAFSRFALQSFFALQAQKGFPFQSGLVLYFGLFKNLQNYKQSLLIWFSLPRAYFCLDAKETKSQGSQINELRVVQFACGSGPNSKTTSIFAPNR
jgi:hypothetical protein